VLADQFARSLRQVWIVNPSMWISFAYFLCKPFMDSELTAKVRVCESFGELKKNFQQMELELPQEIVTEQGPKVVETGIGMWLSSWTHK
jgi:hypothetical protein